MIRPPSGRMGPITPAKRAAIMAKSPVKGKYDTTIDSESAYEKLSQRVAKEAADADQQEEGGGVTDWIGGIFGTNRKRGERLTTGQQVARSVARTVTATRHGPVVASRAGAEGPALVLLHGLAGSEAWWKRNLPALSRAFRVVALDLPGFGSSHPNARLILDEVPSQVAALLDELGIERAHVIGHSMGGLVAGAALAMLLRGSEVWHSADYAMIAAGSALALAGLWLRRGGTEDETSSEAEHPVEDERQDS